MQCSQSLSRPFQGRTNDCVQIPANFIWGSRGMARWFLSHARGRLEGMAEWDKKNKLHFNTVSCVSVISRDWITSLPQIERGVSCCLVENQGWREGRRKAPLEALLCNAPSLSRALSTDDPMIMCRFPKISSEDQGGWLCDFFPTTKPG